MPGVAVLIPTHNHGELLRHSVRSALWQTVQPAELLIVGDGVDAATREVAKSLAGLDPRIRFFDFPKRGRTGEPHRDEVLRQTTCSMVCYLGDDDLWFPNHVETMVDLLAGADFASALLLGIENDGTMVPSRVDLSRRYYRRRMPGESRVPLSAAAHTLDAYRRLPVGWSDTPRGIYTDVWMWTKFARQPWVRMASGGWPTVLKFGATTRTEYSIAQRAAEMSRWEARLSDAGMREELLREVIHAYWRWGVRPAFDLLDGLSRQPARTSKLLDRGAWKGLLRRKVDRYVNWGK